LTDYLNISPDYINKEKEYLVNKTKELEQRWRLSADIESKLNIVHKIVIVVDDGVATGMTAIAAARSLKKQGASQIILATPVISSGALNRLLHEYDQVIALETPSDFGSVGQFYSDFHQVEDMEVVRALAQAMNKSCVKSV
jgi:putative phosphoribosyl transferase